MLFFTPVLLVAAVGLGMMAAALSPTLADVYAAGPLRVEDPWARATPPMAGVAGAYMVIRNTGATDDRLLGGSTAAARAVQIHSMTMDGDVMTMRRLPEGIALPAGDAVTLAPGAYHLMLVDPVTPLKQGDRVPMTLKFETAGPLRVELVVGALGAMAAEGPGGVMPKHHGIALDGAVPRGKAAPDASLVGRTDHDGHGGPAPR